MCTSEEPAGYLHSLTDKYKVTTLKIRFRLEKPIRRPELRQHIDHTTACEREMEMEMIIDNYIYVLRFIAARRMKGERTAE